MMKNIIILVLLLVAIALGILYLTHKCDIPEYAPDPQIEILKDSLQRHSEIKDSLVALADKHKQNSEYWYNKFYINNQEYEEAINELSAFTDDEHYQFFLCWTIGECDNPN